MSNNICEYGGNDETLRNHSSWKVKSGQATRVLAYHHSPDKVPTSQQQMSAHDSIQSTAKVEEKRIPGSTATTGRREIVAISGSGSSFLCLPVRPEWTPEGKA